MIFGNSNCQRRRLCYGGAVNSSTNDKDSSLDMCIGRSALISVITDEQLIKILVAVYATLTINLKAQNFILYLKSLKINQRNYTKVYEIVKVGAILLMFNNKE